MTTRPVYLIVYHSPLFPAHWALFLPNLTSTPSPTPPISSSSPPPPPVPEVHKTGTVLNVAGSSFSGFAHEFKRNYDLEEDGRSYSLFLLDADIDPGLVGDTRGEEPSVDAEGRDELERLALSVPAPGPSLQPGAAKGRRGRAEIRNCQTWLWEAVQAYVEAGMMHSIALERLAAAPVN
ncbi:hypothetical protein CALVIDRAFT_556398 [Calocera viscosa TUFC12733]|uniref:Uncharacterized protein n=1 Tax=Calocera viscosa (strain TUFC12733) TaxID=1330018 RepID=A0A167K7Z9_CALVF|nr:hypothetical protein CALVIDRAFT_556398 [Calocera viscosa TUFC12733]